MVRSHCLLAFAVLAAVLSGLRHVAVAPRMRARLSLVHIFISSHQCRRAVEAIFFGDFNAL
jgi:hypothetical protein